MFCDIGKKKMPDSCINLQKPGLYDLFSILYLVIFVDDYFSCITALAASFSGSMVSRMAAYSLALALSGAMWM